MQQAIKKGERFESNMQNSPVHHRVKPGVKWAVFGSPGTREPSRKAVTMVLSSVNSCAPPSQSSMSTSMPGVLRYKWRTLNSTRIEKYVVLFQLYRQLKKNMESVLEWSPITKESRVQGTQRRKLMNRLQIIYEQATVIEGSWALYHIPALLLNLLQESINLVLLRWRVVQWFDVYHDETTIIEGQWCLYLSDMIASQLTVLPGKSG